MDSGQRRRYDNAMSQYRCQSQLLTEGRTMVKQHRRQHATLLLIAMAIGFLGVYPFRAHPVFAFLMHVFGAAMIGGLADWYAVTALFERPLGIKYKTALIPRSKGRLIEMARVMMVDELLRVPHMYRIIKREHAVRRIIVYFLSDEGRMHWKKMLFSMCKRVADTVELEPLWQELRRTAMRGVTHWQVTPFLIHFCQSLLKPQTASVLWLYINRLLRQLIQANGLRPYIASVVAAMMNRYAEDSFWREVALAFGGDSVSPEHITDLIQRKGAAYLASQESLASPLGQYVYAKAIGVVNELSHNSTWQAYIESKKDHWVINRLEELTAEDMITSSQSLWAMAEIKIIEYAEALLTDEIRLAAVERVVLVSMVPWLRRVRRFVDTAVVKEMSAYAPEKLVTLVRDKLDYDLQMIRINGSLVGAMLGGVFYMVAEVIRRSLFV